LLQDGRPVFPSFAAGAFCPALAGLFFLLVPKCGVGFRELSGVPVASGDQ